MSKKRLSNRKVADIVECEGLGYAITDYMNSDDFEDKHLAELWDQAQTVLKEIEDILEVANEDDEDEDDEDEDDE
jgi:hypothetical protein